MIPITFVRLGNYPGFLCSYDNLHWWKTPLPCPIDTIVDVEWVYGEYNICAVRMIDGTYSVMQSYHDIDDTDADIHWRTVLTTSERIRCIIRPDYGRALIGTSAGWWRSENSGTDWTKVSDQAPNCHTVKELTSDILVALDGTYIWRSTDTGTTWTRSVIAGSSTHVTAITNDPTIDGTASNCIVGCTSTNATIDMNHVRIFTASPDADNNDVMPPDGWKGTVVSHPLSLPLYGHLNTAQFIPLATIDRSYKDILLISDDAAISFYRMYPESGWSFREMSWKIIGAGYISFDDQLYFNPPISAEDYWADGNGWEQIPHVNRRFRFDTYIPASSVFPRDTYNDTITDIEMTGVNESGLAEYVIQVRMSNGLLRHYWVRQVVKVGPELWVIPKFDGYATSGNSLTSSEVNIGGTDLINRTALFAGMNSDHLPLLKSSEDGGETWTDYDPMEATVYNDETMIDPGINNFLEDSYIQYAWSFPICHNGWHIESGYLSKRQSYDVRATIINPAWFDISTYQIDILIDGKSTKSYMSDCHLVQDGVKPYLIDYHCGKLINADYDIDGLIEGKWTSSYIGTGSVITYAIQSYQAGAFIVKDEFPTFDIIQALNIRPPNGAERCYPPDSRLE